MNIPPITERQHATILAALRYWQRMGTLDPHAPEHDIADWDDQIEPLNVDEIDVLIERIRLHL